MNFNDFNPYKRREKQPSTWPQWPNQEQPVPQQSQQPQQSNRAGVTMAGIDNYINTVDAYVRDTVSDPLISASLSETKVELCLLKYSITQDKMVLPEHAKQFCKLMDRAETLVYQSGIFGQQDV